MFIPIQNEAEISGFTLPEYRQKGYFKALLSKASNELKKYEVPDILFVCEPQSLDGKAVIKKLEAQYRQQHLAVLDREFIGMGGISFEQDGAYIFGFGIIPKYQGKGFGKAMLKLMLKNLIEQNVEKIMIEVNSENEKAFNLYIKYGVEVQTAFEYFRKKAYF